LSQYVAYDSFCVGPGHWEELEDNNSDTFISAKSLEAAVASAAIFCHAVDAIMSSTFSGYSFPQVDVSVEEEEIFEDEIVEIEEEYPPEIVRPQKTPTETKAEKKARRRSSNKETPSEPSGASSTSNAGTEPVVPTKMESEEGALPGPTQSTDSATLPSAGLAYWRERQSKTYSKAELVEVGEIISDLRKNELRELDEKYPPLYHGTNPLQPSSSDSSSFKAQRDLIWEINFEGVLSYAVEHGHCDVPSSYVTKLSDDRYRLTPLHVFVQQQLYLLVGVRVFSLGSWLKNQRECLRRCNLSKKRWVHCWNSLN
jgi:hypothetical protein